jgi:hypothetical protein
MADSKKLAALKKAAADLADAIMHDEGGFCLETLHALNAMCEAAGLPDYTGVTAATDWEISGEGEENPRFFGAAAHIDVECN